MGAYTKRAEAAGRHEEMTGLLPPAGVLMIGLFSLLLRATVNIFFIAGQTLFFKTAGVTGLPYVYAVMNVVYISLQAGAVRHLTGSSGTYLQRLSAAFFAVAFVRLFTPVGDSAWLDTGFLLAVMVYELFFNQFFTHWLNEVLPLDEGKRYLPFINGCGSLSFIVSGVVMRLALSVASLQTVLAVDAFAFAGAAALFRLVRGRFRERSEAVSPTSPAPATESSGIDAAPPGADVGRSFANRLAALALLFTLSKYWLDYQYSRAITSAYDTPERLASFIATFTACTDALVLLTQMAVAGFVMKSVRLTRILAFLPVTVGLAAFASTGGAFSAVLATQFLFTWLAKSFHHSAMSLIVGVLPAKPRLRALSTIGICASAGSMASALLLMAVQNNLAPGIAFGSLALVLGLMAASVLPLERAWEAALGHILDGEAAASGRGGRLMAIESLRALSPAERLQRLETLLRGTEEERLAALELLEGIPRVAWQQPLVDLLRTETSPNVRSGIVRRLLSGDGAVSRWIGADLLSAGETDPRVLSNLLEGLADIDADRAFLPWIRTCLGHPHHRVRAAAAEGLIRLNGDVGDIETGLRTLSGMSRSTDPIQRAAAIAVLGRLQHEAFFDELTSGLSDPDERVASQAIAALGRLPLPETGQVLRTAAGTLPKRLAPEAEAAAQSIEMLTCRGISQVVETLDPAERAQVVNRLGTWRHDSRIYLLIRALQVESDGLRAALAESIEKIGAPAVRSLITHGFGQDGSSVVWLADRVAPEIAGLAVQDLGDVALLLRLMREHGAHDRIGTLLVPLLERIERDIDETPVQSVESDLRLRLAITAASARASDPAGVVDALERALRGDRFVASLSWEYLDLQLGTDVAGRLRRLMKPVTSATLSGCG